MRKKSNKLQLRGRTSPPIYVQKATMEKAYVGPITSKFNCLLLRTIPLILRPPKIGNAIMTVGVYPTVEHPSNCSPLVQMRSFAERGVAFTTEPAD